MPVFVVFRGWERSKESCDSRRQRWIDGLRRERRSRNGQIKLMHS